MFGKPNCIELSGVTYPLKCDMVVLEQIQEEFGTIKEFEEAILTWSYKLDKEGNRITRIVKKNGEEKEMFEVTSKWPRAKAVNTGVFYMINEGMECEGKEAPFKTVKEAARVIDKPLDEIADLLHEEFMKCFTRKNQTTTQKNQTTKKDI